MLSPTLRRVERLRVIIGRRGMIIMAKSDITEIVPTITPALMLAIPQLFHLSGVYGVSFGWQ